MAPDGIVPAALPPLPILPATVPLLGTGEDRGLKSIAVIGKPIPGGGVTSNALTVKDSGGVSQQVAVIFQPAASFGEAMVAVVRESGEAPAPNRELASILATPLDTAPAEGEKKNA